MFRKMRREKQEMDLQAVNHVLLNNSTGILAVLGDDDYPYCVPLNYVYNVQKKELYFHCATVGHKIDAIRKHNKVSFCVVDQDKVIPEKFTTAYCSVVLFGTAEEVTLDDEKLEILRFLNQKYSSDFPQEGEEEIKRAWKAVCIVKIKVEHVSGKVGKLLL